MQFDKLINITNHPSKDWPKDQMGAAFAIAKEVVDFPFPAVPPQWGEQEITDCAKRIFSDITATYGTNNIIIHLAGEFTLTYALVSLFLDAGIPCVASCTERKVVMQEDGTKLSKFEFVKFRRYVK